MEKHGEYCRDFRDPHSEKAPCCSEPLSPSLCGCVCVCSSSTLRAHCNLEGVTAHARRGKALARWSHRGPSLSTALTTAGSI